MSWDTSDGWGTSPGAAARAEVASHRWMLRDDARTEAMVGMIEALVRPGMVVADLGTGTGVLAALARRAGASRVYAIESSPIASLTAQMLADNGIDGVTVVQEDMTRVALPEAVDLVVSECLGNFAFSDAMFSAVGAFARRWLKPGGRCAPGQIRLWLQPIDARIMWDPARFWSRPWQGLDLSAFARAEVHHVLTLSAPPALLRATPAQVASFDPYRRPESFVLEAAWDFEAPTAVTGLSGWFEVDWAPGVTTDTGPDAPDTHWGQTFFPLPPHAAQAGQRLEVRVEVHFDPRDNPLYGWSGRWTDTQGRPLSAFSMDERAILGDAAGRWPAGQGPG